MIRSVKKIVSLIAIAGVMSTLTFTSLPAVETKAASSVSVNESGSETSGDLSIPNENDDAEETAASNYGLCDNTKDGTILHCWSWSCNTIKANMKEIAEAGYSSIQTCPINNCKVGSPNLKLMGSDTQNGTDGAWWWYYQPTDWKIGNYVLGSEDDFKSMCDEAHKYGIKVIVDVVPNHTTGDASKVSQDLQNVAGGWDKLYHSAYNQGIGNYNDRYECTLKGCSDGGLYDVNTENPAYQAYFVKYLNQCMADGADGFRYDTAKHIGLPSDPTDPKTQSNGWKNNFWPVVTGKDSANGVTVNNNGGKFVYGEVLQDQNVKESEYGQYINIVATNYGGKIDSAVANHSFNANNLKNWDNPAGGNRCVTWVESHDTFTGSLGSTAWMNDWQIRMCWALIAARKDGTPLFFNRPAGSNGPSGNLWGNNVMGATGNDQFKDPEVVAVNKFRNAMVGQEEYMENYGGYQVLGINRGNQGEVVINLGGDKDLNGYHTNLADGTYTDAVSGNEFKVSGNKFTSGTSKGGKVTVLYKYVAPSNDADVSADKESQSFEGDSIKVTLNAKNCNSAYYIINGGAKVSFNDGETIELGKSLSNGEKVTLNLYGTGNDSSDAEEYTYTKIVKTYEANTLYADKASGWGDMYAYIYSGDGASAKSVAPWPGVKMTYDSTENRYEYQLPAEYQNANTRVIFTDKSKQVPASQQPGKEVIVGKAMVFNGTTINNDVDPTNKVDPLIAGKTTTDVLSPQIVGTSIKITAGQASGGTEGYTYKIAVNGNVIKDYSSSKTATWTPNTFGAYNIEVTVKDSDGTEASDTMSYTITEPQGNPPVMTSFNYTAADKYVGTPITFNATAEGDGTLKYEFVVKLNGTVVYDSGYTTSNKESYTPSKAGNYEITYYVKNAYGVDSNVEELSVIDKPVSTLKFAATKLSVQSPANVGDKVKISALATGEGTVKYRVVVLDSNSKTVYVRGYKKSTFATWTPDKAGKYTICIKAKDSTGTEITKKIDYAVNEVQGCKIDSVNTSVLSDKSIKITTTAESSDTVSYKFYVYDFENDWVCLRNYSTKASVIWQPTVKGSYVIFVQAKDTNGNFDTKAITYEVK